jgi:hypothetical protein
MGAHRRHSCTGQTCVDKTFGFNDLDGDGKNPVITTHHSSATIKEEGSLVICQSVEGGIGKVPKCSIINENDRKPANEDDEITGGERIAGDALERKKKRDTPHIASYIISDDDTVYKS